MRETNLDCCVVRDLLPSYLEELTETETSAMVREHRSENTLSIVRPAASLKRICAGRFLLKKRHSVHLDF